MIERKKRLMMAQSGTQMIDGIPVYRDNCYYPSEDGYLTDIVESNEWFLALVDTGDNNYKSFTVQRFGNDMQVCMRYFTDLALQSYDYSTIWRTDIYKPTPRSFNTYARYYVVSIKKSLAKDFYFKYQTGEYLIKGNNVE